MDYWRNYNATNVSGIFEFRNCRGKIMNSFGHENHLVLDVLIGWNRKIVLREREREKERI